MADTSGKDVRVATRGVVEHARHVPQDDAGDFPNAKSESESMPHVVMYGMAWCRWCRKQSAVLQAEASSMTHAIHMCRADQCQDAGITSVPTLIINNPPHHHSPVRLVGFHTTEQILDALRHSKTSSMR
jgi:glutaredoxin